MKFSVLIYDYYHKQIKAEQIRENKKNSLNLNYNRAMGNICNSDIIRGCPVTM